ncbi:MAG TPA: hypothetical protein VMI54_13240 [Polyangiaceae bacterium]|nr:hypothetical protein [Polyangiaceae bacterium]
MFKRALIAASFLLLAAPVFGAEGEGAHGQSSPSLRDGPTYVLPGRATPATRADRSRYAAREAASPEAKQYRGGGDVVIIGSSAVVLVLVIVLLVVLL